MRVWRGRGAEESHGPYHDFNQAVELAEIEWKAKALQRREFREKTEVELAGPDGDPISMSIKPICAKRGVPDTRSQVDRRRLRRTFCILIDMCPFYQPHG
jgi:hypothetical protein